MEEQKPKSESQQKAEATIAARTPFEQAVITLKNQTKDEVKAVEIAKADLARICSVVKDNRDRLFELVGEPEQEFQSN